MSPPAYPPASLLYISEQLENLVITTRATFDHVKAFLFPSLSTLRLAHCCLHFITVRIKHKPHQVTAFSPAPVSVLYMPVTPHWVTTTLYFWIPSLSLTTPCPPTWQTSKVSSYLRVCPHLRVFLSCLFICCCFLDFTNPVTAFLVTCHSPI